MYLFDANSHIIAHFTKDLSSYFVIKIRYFISKFNNNYVYLHRYKLEKVKALLRKNDKKATQLSSFFI